MSDRPHDEKEEKEEEKEEEKQHEKAEKEEKTWEEKWRRDPLGMVIWPLILIWAGLVLMANNLNLLAEIPVPAGLYPPEWWSVILLGAGVILLLEVIVRLAVPAYRRAVAGTIVLAVVLIAIGLGQIIGKVLLWPLIIVAIGLVILVRGFLPRRRRQ